MQKHERPLTWTAIQGYSRIFDEESRMPKLSRNSRTFQEFQDFQRIPGLSNNSKAFQELQIFSSKSRIFKEFKDFLGIPGVAGFWGLQSLYSRSSQEESGILGLSRNCWTFQAFQNFPGFSELSIIPGLSRNSTTFKGIPGFLRNFKTF